MKARALELLRKYTGAPGTSGCEDAVRRLLADDLGGDLQTDRTGSLIAERAGTAAAPRIMLAAHLDEVGFAVQVVTDDGLLRFVPLGGWWGHTLPAQRVRVYPHGRDPVPGVIAAKPVHLLSDDEKKRVMDTKDMFVDVGASDAAAVRDLGIAPGDAIVPDVALQELAVPDRLMAKAFDNRVGVALLAQTMAALGDHPNTVIAAGTAQEEVGTRGAQTAAAAVAPDIALVLEGPPADDLPGVPKNERQGRLGGGVQLRLLDPSAIMNRKLTRWLADLAAAEGIPCQVAVRHSGGTDARAIHLHDQGVPCAVVGVPARYIHSHNGIIDVNDYLAALRLLLAALSRLDAATARTFTDWL